MPQARQVPNPRHDLFCCKSTRIGKHPPFYGVDVIDSQELAPQIEVGISDIVGISDWGWGELKEFAQADPGEIQNIVNGAWQRRNP